MAEVLIDVDSTRWRCAQVLASTSSITATTAWRVLSACTDDMDIAREAVAMGQAYASDPADWARYILITRRRHGV